MGIRNFGRLGIVASLALASSVAGCGREIELPAVAAPAKSGNALALAAPASDSWPVAVSENFDAGFDASSSGWTTSGPGRLESIDDELCSAYSVQIIHTLRGNVPVYFSQWADLARQAFVAKDLRIQVDLTPTTIYAVSEVRFRHDAASGDHYKLKVYKDNTMSKNVARAELWMIKAGKATRLTYKGINAAKASYAIQADGSGITVLRNGKAFLSSKEKSLGAGGFMLSGWYGGCFDDLEVRSPEAELAAP